MATNRKPGAATAEALTRLAPTDPQLQAALLRVWRDGPGLLEESASRLITSGYAADKAAQDQR